MELDKIYELLMQISGDVKVIKRDLGEDYKVLHGNGHAGLIARVEALEHAEQARNTTWKNIREWIGWLLAVVNFVFLYIFR